MSKKPSSLEDRLVEFTDRFDAALEKERAERVAERKEYEAKREAERKEYEAKREAERKEYEAKRKAERKEYEAKREADRREWAVKIGELNDMWGKLAEFVIKSGILATLNRHQDINVTDLLPNIGIRYQREDGSYEHGEIDIIVTGARDIIVVETKTTLQPSDVSYFLKKYLHDFPRWQASSPHIHLPSCDGMRIFGCVAYMKADQGAEKAAVRAGLITVHAFGDSSKIAHPDTILIDYHPDRRRSS